MVQLLELWCLMHSEIQFSSPSAGPEVHRPLTRLLQYMPTPMEVLDTPDFSKVVFF